MADGRTDVDQMLLTELEPIAGQLLDRHLDKTKEWFPHELVPYSLGSDFEPGEEWDPNAFPLEDDVKSALWVNLLTEDNLPYYFRIIDNMFGEDNAWGVWNRRWTAEEGRHSIVIRDYLTVTRAIDPIALERARMAQVSRGEVPRPGSVADGLAYVALQELATRISHHNTGKKLEESGNKSGHDIMRRVGNDENLHYLFYRDLGTAALELDPSVMIEAITRQVTDFEMPGTGIIDFAEHARAIAKAGIYDYQIHHDDILAPVLMRHWKIDKLEGLTPDGKQAQEKIMKYMGRLGIAARRLGNRKAEAVLA